MEIISFIVAALAVCVVWYFVKGAATLLGLAILGYLVYYMHDTHPAWIEHVTIMLQNWAY